MCGIAGFLINNSALSEKEAENILLKMCRAIRYRGPDDQGTRLIGFDSDRKIKVGLGHNRLSIIDLTMAGHQPMTNEDNSIWLTYNGEIYNFPELREFLIAKGHVFRSKTDTEVIIHGYEEWGAECLERFNGMFAFGLWDAKKKVLMLARDRMGKKPLYYSLAGGNILFASEPKAILQFPGFAREIDRLSLRKYFLYEYVPSPDTIYKGMKRLEAGNVAIWRNGTVSMNQYWNISFNKSTKVAGACVRLKEILKDSVTKRLISDVPLGVFLSGGMDSSSITSLMAEVVPSEHIKTFTIGFEDESFDESGYAREVAGYFKTDHYEKILDPYIMLEILPDILNFLDEPFADASIIPTYLLSKFTRERVKVALSGDGGDELFAGYDTFPAHKLARIYEKIPTFIRKGLLEKIVYSLPVSFDNLSFDFKLKQFLKGIPYPPEVRNQVWLGSFSPDEQNCLLREDINAGGGAHDLFDALYTSLKACDAKNYIELIIYLYCKFYLQDDILVKTDRASMACSLEVRAPLLDYRFVEFACGLPISAKLRGFTTKRIFKKAMKRYLPRVVTRRPKKGFGIPIAKWIRSDAKGLITDELAYDKIKRENLLNPAFIQNVLDEHFNGKKDNRKTLWTLLMFELWYSRWL